MAYEPSDALAAAAAAVLAAVLVAVELRGERRSALLGGFRPAGEVGRLIAAGGGASVDGAWPVELPPGGAVAAAGSSGAGAGAENRDAIAICCRCHRCTLATVERRVMPSGEMKTRAARDEPRSGRGQAEG